MTLVSRFTVCLCDIAVSFIVRKTTYNKRAQPVLALPFCLHLPCLLPCLSVHRKAFNSQIGTIVWVPSPHGSESPHHHHHHCCVTKEQKRECQTPPTRSLSHQSPHLSSRWGCLFSGFLSTPRVLKNGAPLPLEPTTQLPVIHLLRCHAPMARARPLYLPAYQGVLLKSLTTFFTEVCFQDFIPLVAKTLIPKRWGQNPKSILQIKKQQQQRGKMQ